MITSRIDRPDSFEAVRDKIAQILADELEQQKTLATNAGADPSQYDIKVYTELSKPWDVKQKNTIINVWFDNMNHDRSASSTVDIQRFNGFFNIDVIGFGTSTDRTVGHTPGDELGARNAQAGARMARSILMAGQYTYLGEAAPRRVVSSRRVDSVTSFQPQGTSNDADYMVGVRVTLAVTFNEFAPQYDPQILDELFAEIQRAEDGAVLAEVLYNYDIEE